MCMMDPKLYRLIAAHTLVALPREYTLSFEYDDGKGCEVHADDACELFEKLDQYGRENLTHIALTIKTGAQHVRR